MSTINAITVAGPQSNPTITITGSGFGSAPSGTATPAGSGKTGFNYGTSLFINDVTQGFTAGLTTSTTNNSVGLTNLSYSDTSISFQLGSAYSLFLYDLKQGDSLTASVNGAQLNTAASYSPALTTNTVGIARFFSTADGTHFYTSSATEVQQILATRRDLVQEASGGLSAVDPAFPDSNAAPVYRFFDNVHGTHFYTTSASERNNVQSTRADLVYEGVGFNEHVAFVSGDQAVYRFFDTTFGTHFYTASATENANILATRPDLKAEGVAFYAPT